MNENEKNNIDEALNHIKESITNKPENLISTDDNQDFIILDKIVSKGQKKNISYNNNPKLAEKIKNSEKVTKKNSIKRDTSLKKTPSKTKKNPVDSLVDREIKPIIKKWINKNLRAFVKTIVIEEMKVISKATQKPSNR